jgi:hypothetical protein
VKHVCVTGDAVADAQVEHALGVMGMLDERVAAGVVDHDLPGRWR